MCLGRPIFCLAGGRSVPSLCLPLCPNVHFLLYTQEPGSILPPFPPVPQPCLEEGPVVPEEPVSALRGQQAWHWEVGVSPSQLCPSPRLPACLPLPKRESRDRLLSFPVELLRNLAPCMLDLGYREALFHPGLQCPPGGSACGAQPTRALQPFIEWGKCWAVVVP